MSITNYLTMLLGAQTQLTPGVIVGSMVLSFLLSTILATVYQFTFRGFTYSRSYIHTMILGSLVTCMLIMAVGSNIARGMGILGTLSIIRFRTPVRDPRDAMFLFACLGVGIACGANVALVATVGTLVIASVALVLHWAPFASRRDYEGLLRFIILEKSEAVEQEIQAVLQKYCASFFLLGVRDAVQNTSVECSYQVRLLDPSYQNDIVRSLKSIAGVMDPTLLLQRTTVEL